MLATRPQIVYMFHCGTVAGVRSLAFSHHLLSLGGGQGKIHFYDLRAGRYLEAQCGDRWHCQRPRGRPENIFCLETGEGHLARNDIYRWGFDYILAAPSLRKRF